MDKAIEEAMANVNKVDVYLNDNLKGGGHHMNSATGPLADAKKEMSDLKSEVSKAHVSLNQLNGPTVVPRNDSPKCSQKEYIFVWKNDQR